MASLIECKITHPLFGTVWLEQCEFGEIDRRWFVSGLAWEKISGFNIPDGGPYGELVPMWFPIGCVAEAFYGPCCDVHIYHRTRPDRVVEVKVT